MNLSDRDTFYEKMYFHELAERDRLDERFRTLLVVVGIVSAMISFLFDAVILGPDPSSLLFWVIYGLAVVAYAAAIICYLKAWHSQYYKSFPILRNIENYIDQTRQHYQSKTDEHTSAQWTNQAFEEFMRQSFIDHASFNALANDNKRFWLYYGNSFIISAFVFSVMAFFPVADSFF